MKNTLAKISIASATMLAVVGAMAAQNDAETIKLVQNNRNMWRINVGPVWSDGVNAKLEATNLPQLKRAVAGATAVAGTTKEEAKAAAEAGNYDGGGYLHQDGVLTDYTINWKLPESAIDADRTAFVMYNAYSEVSGTSSSSYNSTDSGNTADVDSTMTGIAFELAREMWANDSATFGIDFSFGVNYFFTDDIYAANGRAQSSASSQNVVAGRYKTIVGAEAAIMEYDFGSFSEPTDGMMGYGNPNGGAGPTIAWAEVQAPVDEQISSSAGSKSSTSMSYSATGDYEELEFVVAFKPWYQVTDWLKLIGTLGVATSRGKFAYNIALTMNGANTNYSEEIDEWDVYGVVGAGLLLQYDCFNLGFDFVGRFGHDDFNVDGDYVKGEIERGSWYARLMLGFEF